MAEQEKSRPIRVFRNGRNQAIRIPRDYELPTPRAIIRKEGDRLIIEPEHRPSLSALLRSWTPLEEAFPDVDEELPPPDEVDL